MSGQLHDQATLPRRKGMDSVAKRKNPYPCRESNPGRPASSLVTKLTELLWILTYVLTTNFVSSVATWPCVPVQFIMCRGEEGGGD
jgi:hypothetical protein